MTAMTLDDTLILGKGNLRLCYLHPDDSSKVIKVAYKDQNVRNQNEVEEIYYKYLEKKGVSFSHLTRCYGTINVNGKKGLVFDRVIDSDGSMTLTFSEAVAMKVITSEYARTLLDDLKEYLSKNSILFVDVNLDNIMCRHEENGSYTLIIIDGLGARRPGFKFWLYRHFPPYTAYKVKKVMCDFDCLLKES